MIFNLISTNEVRNYLSLTSLTSMIPLLMLTAGIMGCSTAPPEKKYSVKAPYREPSTLNRGEIMHVETGQLLSVEELINYIAPFRVVYVGETHDSVEDHKVQLEIIKRLYRKLQGKIAIGFEMLQRPSQPEVDAYIDGKISQKKFLKVWGKNWHGLYDYYIDIIRFARQNNIKMLALNAEDDLRKLVRDKDIESLDEETRERLPEMDFDDPHYNAFIEAVFGGHGHGDGSPKYVDMFKKMQTLWDETMADTAAKYLQSPEGEGKLLVVISGGGHVQFGFGIPRRVFRRAPLPYVTIEPYPVEVAVEKENNTIEVKPVEIPIKPFDFYWAVKYEGLENKRVMLGISMETAKEGGVKVSSVVPGSAAEHAGIIAGDVIVAMDGKEVKEFFDVTYNVRSHKVKDKGVVEVSRDGTRIKFDIVYDTLKPHHKKPSGK